MLALQKGSHEKVNGALDFSLYNVVKLTEQPEEPKEDKKKRCLQGRLLH